METFYRVCSENDRSVEWISCIHGIFIVTSGADICRRAWRLPAQRWQWEIVIDFSSLKRDGKTFSGIELGG